MSQTRRELIASLATAIVGTTVAPILPETITLRPIAYLDAESVGWSRPTYEIYQQIIDDLLGHFRRIYRREPTVIDLETLKMMAMGITEAIDGLKLLANGKPTKYLRAHD